MLGLKRKGNSLLFVALGRRLKATRSGPATPIAASDAKPRQQLSTSSTSSIIDHVPTTLACALQAAKDLGEIAEHIPYVKAISGLSLTLLKMWEEVHELDARAAELMKRVASRVAAVDRMLRELPAGSSKRLQGLERDLKDYEIVLSSIHAKVVEYTRLGSVLRTLKRGAIRETIQEFIRDLEHSDQQFTRQRLFEISAILEETNGKGEASSTAIVDAMYEDPVPPAPTQFLGRHEETSEIIALLRTCPNPRVVILGAGGMGKTTLARAVLNDPAIASAFGLVLFVSCEQLTTVFGILSSLANVLDIPSHERDQSLKKNVMARLRATSALLCLDNFEDPWDPPHTRGDVEKFLQLLCGIPRLGLLVTMRGAERPHGVDWTHPRPPPLTPLDDESACQLFHNISGIAEDKRVPDFLAQLENIPLAIELLARQVNPPHDNLDAVLRRWEEHGLEMFNRGDQSDKKLTSVTKSIELSLQSPRIINVPHILDVLSIVAFLPDGLAESSVQSLQCRLPPSIDVTRCLRELVQTSLCYHDITGRFRLLALIRQHVTLTIPVLEEHKEAVQITMLEYALKDEGDRDIVGPELGNIRSVFAHLEGVWGDWYIRACLSYLWWADYLLGIRDTQLASEAMRHARTPEFQVRCLISISRLLRYSSQYEEAERLLRPALSIPTDSQYWDGHVQLEMGGLLVGIQAYDEAELCLKRAAELFRLTKNTVWEGSALESLGCLLQRWGRYPESEIVLKQSLLLAKVAKTVLHEANALTGLGRLYRRTNRLPEAEYFYQLAVKCAELYTLLQTKVMLAAV